MIKLERNLQLELAELKIPRYTSYPTAPHFHSAISAIQYAEWLETIKEGEETSIYLHIPFCRKLCWFCGCHTKIVNYNEPIKKYVGLLKKEISMVADRTSGLKIRHIHFGGGSPTILESDDFLAIMTLLEEAFYIQEDAEIAVEIDPRTLTEATVAAYAKAGVNRASLGVQDFNPKVQEAVNRIQPFGTVYQATQQLREYGISKINIDLMYGLPHQTVGGLLDTIDLTFTLNPDRIALFGYAHVPWMKKNQQLIDEKALPDTVFRIEMAESAKLELEKSGYMSIGIDHFAKDDDELSKACINQTLRRNFQGYTTDRSEILLGFGVSAIGSFPQGYIQNISSSREYEHSIKNDTLPVTRGIALSPEDKLRRNIIESLMCHMSVDIEKLKEEHGLDDDIDFTTEFADLYSLQHDGLVEIKDTRITVTDVGRTYLRIISSTFDAYLKPSRKKHASAI